MTARGFADFIIRALIEGHWIEMMTICEFYLARPEKSSELRIVPNRGYINRVSVVYDQNYDEETKTIHGNFWEFQYGFLWTYGVI